MPPKETLDLIFRLIDQNAHRTPKALLQDLQREGLDQADAKEGLSYLLNEEKIELTPASELRRLHETVA